MRVVSAANDVNRLQKSVIADKILRFFNNSISGKKFAIWGLAFKPDTDDVREAPAIITAQKLSREGAVLSVHDPEALTNARSVLGDDSITYHTDAYDALEKVDGLIIMTEWKEYRSPDWKRVHNLMATHAVFDGRNLYNSDEMKELGFRYFGIGHGEKI